MSAQYYTSFLIHGGEQDVATEYSGIVETQNRLPMPLGTQELTDLLARNLDVAAENVEVLQWGPLH
jgi:hypothetical protein